MCGFLSLGMCTVWISQGSATARSDRFRNAIDRHYFHSLKIKSDSSLNSLSYLKDFRALIVGDYFQHHGGKGYGRAFFPPAVPFRSG